MNARRASCLLSPILAVLLYGCGVLPKPIRYNTQTTAGTVSETANQMGFRTVFPYRRIEPGDVFLAGGTSAEFVAAQKAGKPVPLSRRINRLSVAEKLYADQLDLRAAGADKVPGARIVYLADNTRRPIIAGPAAALGLSFSGQRKFDGGVAGGIPLVSAALGGSSTNHGSYSASAPQLMYIGVPLGRPEFAPMWLDSAGNVDVRKLLGEYSASQLLGEAECPSKTNLDGCKVRIVLVSDAYYTTELNIDVVAEKAVDVSAEAKATLTVADALSAASGQVQNILESSTDGVTAKVKKVLADEKIKGAVAKKVTDAVEGIVGTATSASGTALLSVADVVKALPLPPLSGIGSVKGHVNYVSADRRAFGLNLQLDEPVGVGYNGFEISLVSHVSGDGITWSATVLAATNSHPVVIGGDTEGPAGCKKLKDKPARYQECLKNHSPKP